jgi:hypothetical protein
MDSLIERNFCRLSKNVGLTGLLDSTKQAYVMAYEEVTIGFVTRKFSGQQFSSYVTQIIGSLLTYGIIVGLFRH